MPCLANIPQKYISQESKTDPMSFQQCFSITTFHSFSFILTCAGSFSSPTHMEQAWLPCCSISPLNWCGWSQYLHRGVGRHIYPYRHWAHWSGERTTKERVTFTGNECVLTYCVHAFKLCQVSVQQTIYTPVLLSTCTYLFFTRLSCRVINGTFCLGNGHFKIKPGPGAAEANHTASQCLLHHRPGKTCLGTRGKHCIVGAQKGSPQDVPLWQMDYFVTKGNPNPLGWRETSAPLLNCREEFKLGALIRDY